MSEFFFSLTRGRIFAFLKQVGKMFFSIDKLIKCDKTQEYESTVVIITFVGIWFHSLDVLAFNNFIALITSVVVKLGRENEFIVDGGKCNIQVDILLKDFVISRPNLMKKLFIYCAGFSITLPVIVTTSLLLLLVTLRSLFIICHAFFYHCLFHFFRFIIGFNEFF